MSSKAKVSKQVKVTQGDTTTTFELVRRGIVIRHTTPKLTAPDGGHGYIEFTLGKPTMDALRELLGIQQPSQAKALTPDKPLTLPAEEFDERFKKEQPGPPREPDGTPTPEGLSRKADGTEEGMGE